MASIHGGSVLAWTGDGAFEAFPLTSPCETEKKRTVIDASRSSPGRAQAAARQDGEGGRPERVRVLQAHPEPGRSLGWRVRRTHVPHSWWVALS